MPDLENVTGVILAGGKSRRFGDGDKFLNKLKGRPLLEWVIERVRPQVTQTILNTNSEPDNFESYGMPVVADVIEGFAGPLAGILTGMEWVGANNEGCNWIATFPADAPFVPADLVARMLDRAAIDDAEIVCAVSDGRAHPVCALWQVNLASSLRQAMEEEGMRKTDLWTSRFKLSGIEFPIEPYDPFYNINRRDDLEEAERIASLLAD